MTRLRLLLCILLLTAAVLLLPACGDDDPVAPPLEYALPSLGTATHASVELWVLGILSNRGDIALQWDNYGTAYTPGTYADSNQVFAGEEEVFGTFTRDLNRVHLEFDRVTGDITRLVSRKEHANPSFSTYQNAAAHGIPLHSYTATDTTWEAVWRLDGVLVCAAIDSMDFHHNRYVDDFLTWSCASEEEAVLEVRVWQ